MDFEIMKRLAAISRSENIAAASEQLNISPHAIYAMLKAMEDGIGAPLSAKGKRGALLNENGTYLAQSMQKLLVQYEDTLSLLQENQTDSGVIRIGIFSDSDGFYELLKYLRNQFKNVRFHLRSMRTDRSDFVNTDMDFYILPKSKLLNLPGISIAVSKDLYFLANANHPLAHEKSVHLEDLTGERFVFLMRQDGRIETTYHYFQQAGFKPDIAFFADDIFTQLELVHRGEVVMVTHNTFRGFRNSISDLVEIPVEADDIMKEDIYLAWSPECANPLAMRIVDYLQKEFPNGFRRSSNRSSAL